MLPSTHLYPLMDQAAMNAVVTEARDLVKTCGHTDALLTTAATNLKVCAAAQKPWNLWFFGNFIICVFSGLIERNAWSVRRKEQNNIFYSTCK